MGDNTFPQDVLDAVGSDALARKVANHEAFPPTGLSTATTQGVVGQRKVNYEGFDVMANSIINTKDLQDMRDYNVIIEKKESNKSSFAIKDIVDSNRLPQLKTKLLTPATHSAAWEKCHLSRLPNESSAILTGSFSRLDSSFAEKQSDLGGAKRYLSLRAQESKELTQTSQDVRDENEKLADVLQTMDNARQIIDSSRLYYDAAVQFLAMEMYERAIFCLRKSTQRISAPLVVDTYDLPEDEKYRRKIERMSNFQKPKFFAERAELRRQLIYAEEERQRLRARDAHFQLVYIQTMVDEHVDLAAAHTNLRAAFRCCSNDTEHVEYLMRFHSLLKDFSAVKRQELSIDKQILRHTRGPLAESHLSILHELEALFPENADVHEWLGFRYTEKSDFDAAHFHYKKLRDILDPPPDMSETLMLWGAAFKQPARNADGTANRDDPEQQRQDRDIRANVMKNQLNYYNETTGANASTNANTNTKLKPSTRSVSTVGTGVSGTSRGPGSSVPTLRGPPPDMTAETLGAASVSSSGGLAVSQDTNNFTAMFNSSQAQQILRKQQQHEQQQQEELTRLLHQQESGPTIKHMADMAAKIKEKQERQLARKVQAATGTSSVALANTIRKDLLEAKTPKVMSLQNLSPEKRQQLAKEQHDLAWFAGKHSDSTTIVYTAPRQGWNTEPIPR